MFEKELEIGQTAVIEAMRICKTIQNDLTGADSITKPDKSPVTIADFTSQAIICRILMENFQGIPITAEEDSGVLQKPQHEETLKKILQYIANDGKVGEILNKENLFQSIDMGGHDPADDMFWTLDPIDGTKGFLRGEQFAIALALIVKGEVQLGVLGCPNLRLPENISRCGSLLFAVKGQGAKLQDVETGKRETVTVSNLTDTGKMRFVESYVSAHSNLEMQLQIARILKMERDPIQMDSQVKYGVLATGNGEIYIRIPHPNTPDYKEKIWDHAAGSVIVEEAGGVVTDIFGEKLDFNAGKTLKNNRGVFASVPSIHDRILGIIKELNKSI